MVERIYGVEHAIQNMVTGESRIHPSFEMISELRSLPHGTTVGIGYTPELTKSLKFGQIKLKMSPITIKYWQEIKQICTNLDFKVIYLDDISVYQKLIKQYLIMKNCKNIRDKIEAGKDNENNKDRIKALKTKHYEATIINDYIFKIERENAMLDKIAKSKPDVIIVGKGHSDLFFLDSDNVRKNGIILGKYKTDIVSGEENELFYDNLLSIATLIDNPILDKKSLVERESLKRAIRAIKEGVIIPGGKPNFTGTWMRDCPPQGLFEIYVNYLNNNCFTGVIEDVIGRADVTGTIDETNVSFTKKYYPDKATGKAISVPIYYSGTVNDKGEYIGFWKTHKNEKDYEEQSFILKKTLPHRID